jgi:hypothetical protein
MPTAEFFRAKAQQCRELLAVAKVPEVIAQLELWIREFEEAAKQAEAMVGPVTVVTPKSTEGN